MKNKTVAFNSGIRGSAVVPIHIEIYVYVYIYACTPSEILSRFNTVGEYLHKNPGIRFIHEREFINKGLKTCANINILYICMYICTTESIQNVCYSDFIVIL